ncbi:MAG: site-2 protease family protein [Candidatus Binatia bacterium]
MSLPMPPDPYHLNGYHSTPQPDEVPVTLEQHIPWLHIFLFAATLLTTSLAGAFQQGADPFSDPKTILLGLPFAVTLMSILLFHEMGHYLFARYHGVRASLPYFIPGPPLFVGTFGAFIRMQSAPADRRALFDVGAAGPWAGAMLAIPAVMLGLSLSEVRPLNPFNEGGIILGDSFLFSALTRLILGVSADNVTIILHPIALAGWFGLFVTFLNLIPVGQLDGGHVAYSLFGRTHRWISRLALVGILLLGFQGWEGWFFWVVLLALLGLDHPPTLDLTSPLDPRRRLYAWGTIGLFALTFIPVPISMVDQPEFPTGEVIHINYLHTQPAPVRPFTFVYRP